MKHTKIILAALLAAALTACSDTSTAEVTETAAESSAPVSETAAETTTEATTAEETVTTTEIATERLTEDIAETETEDVLQADETEFFDFELIENYQGTTDIGDLAEKSVEFLMSTDEYAEAMSNLDKISEEFGDPYIADGKLIPKFKVAYPEDYDGDGKTETFVTVQMPFYNYSNVLTDFFIFSDSEGNMALIDYIGNTYDTVFLNYGKYKQITFGGFGTMGAEDNTKLYGVKNRNSVELYSIRGSFYKENCFLVTDGWMGVGDFMYFDTAKQEYCAIVGTEIDIEDIKAMDTTDSLAEIWEQYNTEEGYPKCYFLGGNYYCILPCMMDASGMIYTYEGGCFTLLENTRIRMSTPAYELEEVTEIDIGHAIANMKTVK